MITPSLLAKVDYPQKPFMLRCCDGGLFFARSAFGAKNYRYTKIQDTYQLEITKQVESIALRILFAIIATVFIIPTLIALGVKAYMKKRQEANVVKIATALAPVVTPTGNPTSVSNPQVQLSKAVANFANTLCAKIGTEKKSYSISPISILIVLGICLYAIKLERKEAFIEKIGLKGYTEDRVHHILSDALKKIAFDPTNKNGSLILAQALAYKDKRLVDSSFIDFVKNIYMGETIVAQDLQKAVNNWVDQQTRHKITRILNDNNGDVVLLNAVYLNLQWEDKFKKPSNGWPIEKFSFADGSAADVSMMSRTGRYSIYDGPSFSLLEIPYLVPQGRKLSQLIILPKDPKDLEAIEKGITSEKIQEYRFSATPYNKVDLRMPKIRMSSEFDLKPILQSLQLPLDAIDPRMIKWGEVTSLLHKTYVLNDEDGTEAAAITGLECECTAMPDFNEPRLFNIKHSYAYIIMSEETILFRGRVNDQNPLVVDLSTASAMI